MRKKTILLLLLSLSMTALQAANISQKKVIPTPKLLTGKSPTASRHVRKAGEERRGVVTTLKFEKIADMAMSRTGHQTFPSGNGFVVVGGQTTGKQPIKTAELYKNGSWKSLNLSSAHDEGFSAILDGGRAMVGGGFTAAGSQHQGRSTEIYDPATQTFSPGPDMTIGRAGCKAIVVGGKLYVSGNKNADDPSIDCYDGSGFTAVGNMDARQNPYMFTDSKGSIIVLSLFKPDGSLMDYYTYSDGSQGLVADYYEPSTGETSYIGTPYDDDLLPVPLPADVRSSDYHFTGSDDKNLYVILAAVMETGDDYSYKLLLFDSDEKKTYVFSDLELPRKHPVSGAEIDYRGGVIINRTREELYIIGHSGYWENETLHLVSFNYNTYAWTIASADGFDHDMTETAAWTLLPDGRLACTGGIGDKLEPSRHAYIITPPTAGQGGDDSGGEDQKSATLVVTTKDGMQTSFVLLNEKPRVTFEGKDLKISTSKGIVSFALSDVLRFNYVNLSTSGIQEVNDEPDTDISYQQEDGMLVLSQLQAGAQVAIYTLDGKLVRRLDPRHTGTFRVDLSALTHGVYIVKAGTLTYKIMKR